MAINCIASRLTFNEVCSSDSPCTDIINRESVQVSIKMHKLMILLSFILIYCTCHFQCVMGEHFSDERIRNVTIALEAKLAQYDNRLRPNFGGPTLSIGIDMEVVAINSISEANMEYTISMYVRQHWRDDRLAYDSAYGNVSVDGRLADRIWVPDTYLVNDKRSFVHDVTVKNRLLRFHHDGTIMYGIRMTTVAACMMDLRNYPMDEQNCTLELESYGYTTDDIVFTWQYGDDSIEGFENIEMPQFALVEYDLNARNIFSAESYPRLSMSFRIRRNIGFFILQTYLPSILIVILSWVSFWINHEATAARVALGITTVLTMTTISTSVRATLPAISYIKSIDIYVVTCFAFVFTALLEYALVNFNHWGQFRKQRNKEEKRKYSHGYVPVSQHESPVRRQQINSDDDDDDDWSDSEAPSSSFRSYQYSQTNSPCRLRGKKHGQLRHAWFSLGRRHQARKRKRRRSTLPNIKNVDNIDSMSRILFPVGFVLFNIAYWFSYLKIFYGSDALPAMVQF